MSAARALSTALAESIDDQMDEWRMTRSEKDVAWFIIKGCRFSEIAELRSVKESTARLQATSVYAKAGVSGRAEFVAEVFQPLLMDIPSDPSLRREERKQEEIGVDAPAARERHDVVLYSPKRSGMPRGLGRRSNVEGLAPLFERALR